MNNEYVVAHSTEILVIRNPADGSLIANDMPLAARNDADNAVEYANRAFHTAFGKFEIDLAADPFECYTGWIDNYTGESYPAEDEFYKIVHNEPLGVCAGIIPWNTPLASAALAIGNCFILKTSEKTPFAGLELGVLIKEAGFPPGVFQVLSGDGSIRALLAAHMKVNKKVQRTAASSNLKRCTLELGGKSPAVIFEDTSLENVVIWRVNRLVANTDKISFATTPVYVQGSIYDRLIEAYRSAIEDKTRRTGDPARTGTELGKAEKQGTLLICGKRIEAQGFFFEPIVFTNVHSDAEILRQVIFGRVSMVNTFKTEAKLLEKPNGTVFRLKAGVFTQDITPALRVLSKVDAGVSLDSFGGSKESGIGREMGHFALRAYTEPRQF
ncbi:ALDH-like protein [Zopfia rhizophila CBS 207.26]|uniref:aldehyde dehydrogenase (NAD(+)) n=1 Tax=Zopfia rhizophila CBS 207.26 TaxID=1314779 RepID=A0A6A6DU27_9PEZI|nr:ALDH-like protein [Zopfia rhizophila CBS 207.26]